MISRIAVLTALGLGALTFSASAAPAISGSTDVRTDRSEQIQVAQYNRTRAINEARGGGYKKAKKSKKAKKKM